MRLATQIDRDGRYNYVKIDTDSPVKLEDAVGEVHGDQWFDAGRQEKVTDSLQRFFENHAEFYDYIDFDAGREHGSTGQDFRSGGFKKFTKEFFDGNTRYINKVDDMDKMQMVCDALGQKLAEIVQEYEDQDADDDFAVRSQINLDKGESEGLRDPELLEDALLVGRDGTYSIKVQELENAQNIEEVEERVRDQTKDTYEAQVQAQVGTLKQRIRDLQNRLEEEKTEMMLEGVRMIGEVDDWEVEEVNGEKRLVYQKKIHPASVRWRDRVGDGRIREVQDEVVREPQELSEEGREAFYIEGLNMRIKENVTKLYFKDAHHPNALSGSKSCTGSFSASITDAMEEAVKQVKQIDLHDFDNNDAEREMKENFDEYVKTDEDGEVQQTAEVWTT